MGWRRKSRFLSLAFSVILNFSNNAFSCAGDGPTPFKEVENFQPQVDSLPNSQGIREYLFWEKRSQVIYRNLNDQLLGFDLNARASYAIGKLQYPLSSLTDPTESYLLTSPVKGNSWLLNLFSEATAWSPVAVQTPMQYAFWDEDTLYGVNLEKKGTSQYVLSTYKTQAGTAAVEACDPITIDSQTPIHLSTGHSFPFIYFYTSIATPQGYQLLLSKFNVNKCKIKDDDISGKVFAGEIQNVYRFPAQEALAVKVNNLKENLYWQNADGCKFYDIDNKIPVVPNVNQPVFATWTNQGLALHYLSTSQRVTLLGDLPVSALSDGDLRLSSDGSRLLYAPQVPERNFRWLMDIYLAGFAPRS